MSLEITISEHEEESRVVGLAGRLDTTTAPELEEALASILAAKPRNLVLDLEALKYISSMGLREVLKARKNMEAFGGKLVLLNMQPQIREVFDLANIIDKVDIFDDIESADAYLRAIQRRVTLQSENMDFP